MTRRLVASIALALFACSGGSQTTPAGAGGPSPAPPPQPDAGAPVVPSPPGTASLGGAPEGATVAGEVALSASVPAGTSEVDYQLDGVALARATSAPFGLTWDTFSVANGAHALSLVARDASGNAIASPAVHVDVQNHVKNVFVIVMENHDWSSIAGNAAAPYINKTLLSLGAHAEKYMNVPGLHPSLPNYLWLEAGTNFGIFDDGLPAVHPLSSKQHLTTLLQNAGISWKAYEEDISGSDCPTANVNRYVPRHNPAVYFTDVNGASSGAYCIAHVRPYSELAGDLEAGTVPAYAFITPNLCNDMHDCSVGSGDAWLSREVPKILASRAYKDGGALFITWDESEGSDVPIGFIALSPLAKAGYASQAALNHSSTLRSIEEIFGLTAMLGDAANASDVRDLFRSFP